MAEEQNLNEEIREEDVKEETEETPETEESSKEAADAGTEDNASGETEEGAEEGEPGGIPITDGDEEAAPEKKRFFKKKDKEKKKDSREQRIEELTDRLQRLMAEFDNYRKRTEKEKAAMYDMGASATIEKLLPVLDNFERGLASVPEEQKTSSVYVGMDMIYKQMIKVLTDMGVEPIDAAGKEFDPNLHNAVMQTESEELPENTVAQELQKGYTYKGTVIRHSMVSVVK